MAKFRRQHSRGRSGGVFSGRLIMIFIIMAVLVVGVLYFAKTDLFVNVEDSQTPDYNLPESRFFLPDLKNGSLVHHKYYSLSYDESTEQAEWVAYYLTRASLKAKNVARAKRFNPDPLVSTRSAMHGDYIRSGFDRGHLVPAADMAFSKTAMQETFFMSNISPQVKQFNGAIWRELEESVRDWAFKYGGLYVVSGPIFGQKPQRIGKAGVAVPKAFFKVLLDLESKNKKAVAFRMANKVSYKPLSDYMISVDQLEEEIGFDFFDDLLENEVEEALESNISLDEWPYSKKRFDLRNTKWNRIK